MDESLPLRRHSFACLSNDNHQLVNGSPYYSDSAAPYLVNHIEQIRASKVISDVDDPRLAGDNWTDGGGSLPSCYASPHSSLFFVAASAASHHPSTSECVSDRHLHLDPSTDQHLHFHNCNDHSLTSECAYTGWTTETGVPPGEQCRPILSTGGSSKSSKKSRKKWATLANGKTATKSNKAIRVTTFNLKPTYIPPPTPRMSMCGPSCECEGSNHHHLISTNDYVVTIEQLKMTRERAREKVRRIVVGVSVTLTLLAVVLVTAFLALGSKLEQQERNGKHQLFGKSSPFAEDTDTAGAGGNVPSADAQKPSSPKYHSSREFSSDRQDRKGPPSGNGKAFSEK